jgi:hypothetical protein
MEELRQQGRQRVASLLSEVMLLLLLLNPTHTQTTISNSNFFHVMFAHQSYLLSLHLRESFSL